MKTLSKIRSLALLAGFFVGQVMVAQEEAPSLPSALECLGNASEAAWQIPGDSIPSRGGQLVAISTEFSLNGDDYMGFRILRDYLQYNQEHLIMLSPHEWGMVAQAYATAGRFSETVEAYEQSDFETTPYPGAIEMIIASGFIHAKRFKEARYMAWQIPEGNPSRTRLLCIVSMALRESGEVPQSKSLYVEALSELEKIESLDSRQREASGMIDMLRSQGLVDEAEKLRLAYLKDAKSEDVQSDDPERVEPIEEPSIEAIMANPDVVDKIIQLRQLAKGFAEQGNVEAAVKWTKESNRAAKAELNRIEASSSSLKFNEMMAAQRLAFTIIELAELGELEEAVALAANVQRQPSAHADLLARLSVLYHSKGNGERCWELAGQAFEAALRAEGSRPSLYEKHHSGLSVWLTIYETELSELSYEWQQQVIDAWVQQYGERSEANDTGGFDGVISYIEDFDSFFEQCREANTDELIEKLMERIHEFPPLYRSYLWRLSARMERK